GVAAGFCLPVLPFAVAAPRGFYDSVVVAQLVRTGTRTPIGFRVQQLTGLTAWHPGAAALPAAAIPGALIAGGLLISAWLVTRSPLAPLEWFAMVTAGVGGGPVFVSPRFFFPHPPPP